MSMADLLHLHYAVEQDHRALISLIDHPPEALKSGFDALRKHYPARYEFTRTGFSNIADKKTASQIARLGFSMPG